MGGYEIRRQYSTKLCTSISNPGGSLLYEKVVKLIKNPTTSLRPYSSLLYRIKFGSFYITFLPYLRIYLNLPDNEITFFKVTK